MKVWAYIHPELNILCCAVLPEAVSSDVQAIELEVDSPDDVVFIDGVIRVKTEDEMIRDKKAEKLSQLKSIVYALLQPTDWVVTKCTELGLDIAVAYPEVKQKRDAVRVWNNQKENEINNATTVEELNSISLEFGR